MFEAAPEVLMAVGAGIWIIGEMMAVIRHQMGHRDETTSWYVHHFMRKWFLARVGVVLFTIWLFLHFNFSILPR